MGVILKVNGMKFWATTKQIAAIETLMAANKGGFARVNGYVSTTDYVKPQTANLTVLTRFSVENLYKRKIAALQALTFTDVMDKVLDDDAAKARAKVFDLQELQAIFAERRAKEIESMEKTLAGIRDDAHRQGHDRCYIRITDGVKAHLRTEKVDGVMVPVLRDGVPILDSVILHAITISQDVITEGERKIVNSGIPVLISKAMERLMPKSTKIRSLALKENNFDSVMIGGNVILPQEMQGI